jgi:hypothetical protein
VQPPNALLDQIAKLIAADATTLGSATALKLHLAMANFTPSPALLLAGLTEATFAGYAAINLVTGTQLEYVDGVSGLRTVELKAPAGGLNFTVTGAANLPQTIYGYYVTDNGVTVLYGSALFPSPINLTVVGQGFDVPPLRFAFSNSSPV